MKRIGVLLLALWSWTLAYDAYAQSESGINDSSWFSAMTDRALLARNVFKLTGATADECARKCLSMRGRCLSFDFHRRTGSCFGRKVGHEAFSKRVRPYVRKNRNYDLYVTTLNRVTQALANRHRSNLQQQLRTVQPTREYQPPIPVVDAPPPLRRDYPNRARNFRPSLPTTPTTSTTLATTMVATATPQRVIVAGQECRKAIGIENGKVPDAAFAASSHYWTYLPQNARLNSDSTWMSETNDNEQYLEIDFGGHVPITAIGTQGFYNVFLQNYVSKYKILYENKRTDGTFRAYREIVETDMIFDGNWDATTEQVNYFQRQPLVVRRLRIVPIDWYRNIALRVEIYTICGRRPQGV